MKVLLQRVSSATVRIDDHPVGSIGRGYCLLVGFTHDDGAAELQWMAEKIAGLRLFGDDEGKMNRDLAEVGGAILLVSQFTLYGDAVKGRRPSFTDAARPEQAEALYLEFRTLLAAKGFAVATGRFGADMQVEIHNDGPVTMMLERGSSRG